MFHFILTYGEKNDLASQWLWSERPRQSADLVDALDRTDRTAPWLWGEGMQTRSLIFLVLEASKFPSFLSFFPSLILFNRVTESSTQTRKSILDSSPKFRFYDPPCLSMAGSTAQRGLPVNGHSYVSNSKKKSSKSMANRNAVINGLVDFFACLLHNGWPIHI